MSVARGVLVTALLFGACSDPAADEDPGPGPADAGTDQGAPADTGPGDEGVADAPDPLAPRTVGVFEHRRITSKAGEPNFHHVEADYDLGAGPFAHATMIVDLETTCFPFESWDDNLPPDGQNWPIDCDPWDRNFEITIDEPKGAGDSPAVELMRAFTPFGGPLHLEIDVTDVANGLPGKHRARVSIPSYGDPKGLASGMEAGWGVSVRFEVEPGPAPRKVLAVVPVWNLWQNDTAPPPSGTFDVPAGTKSTRIEYRVTGHGQGEGKGPNCIGPAEEFCKRTHHVSLDDADIAEGLRPWRGDCKVLCDIGRYTRADGTIKTYCKQNPFGDQNSVRAPRANWCPGSLTPPIVWEPPSATTPGTHALTYQVDGVEPKGMWRTSAVVFAYGE